MIMSSAISGTATNALAIADIESVNASRRSDAQNANRASSNTASADQVRLSGDRQYLSRANILAGRQSTMELYRTNPAYGAAQLRINAYDEFDNGNIGGWLDLSDVKSGAFDKGVVRYMDGSPVTLESQAYWKEHNGIYNQEKRRIYETETAKGTPPAEIFDKMMKAFDSQPLRYRAMMGDVEEYMGTQAYKTGIANDRNISMNDLMAALDKTVSGTSFSSFVSNTEKKTTYHKHIQKHDNAKSLYQRIIESEYLPQTIKADLAKNVKLRV